MTSKQLGWVRRGRGVGGGAEIRVPDYDED